MDACCDNIEWMHYFYLNDIVWMYFVMKKNGCVCNNIVYMDAFCNGVKWMHVVMT